MIRTLAAVGAAILLSACSGPRGPFVDVLLSTGGTNTAGAHQIFYEEAYERIDLVTLLDPENRRSTLPRIAIAQPSTSNSVGLTYAADMAVAAPNTELERAFQAFYMYPSGLEERRTRIQDRVLAASEQRCNTYKLYLRRVETGQSTLTGILSTVLGGAGAIVTNTNAARGLAGLAGISSGIGAELKQGYFANVASHVVVPGIDLARSELRRELLAKRNASATVYTVEAALVDASRYHAACSINTGLERAGEAVRETNNPGIRQMSVTLSQLNIAQKLTKRLTGEKVEFTDEERFGADFLVSGSAIPSTRVGIMLDSRSFVERHIRLVSDRMAALESLNQLAEKKAEEIEKSLIDGGLASEKFATTEKCNALESGPKEACLTRLKLKAVTTQGADGTRTIPDFRAALKGMKIGDLLAVFAGYDAEVRAAEYALRNAAPGTAAELEARRQLQDARSTKETAYGPMDLKVAKLDLATSSLRTEILNGKRDGIEKALPPLQSAVNAIVSAHADKKP